MQLNGEIRSYIVDTFLYGQDDNSLGDDSSFLEKGIIDSTGVLELVSFIQEKYTIQVHDEEILPDNFDSLRKLSAFIIRKRSALDTI